MCERPREREYLTASTISHGSGKPARTGARSRAGFRWETGLLSVWWGFGGEAPGRKRRGTPRRRADRRNVVIFMIFIYNIHDSLDAFVGRPLMQPKEKPVHASGRASL